MPSLSPLELIVIFVVALVVFGPSQLPELARKVGRGLAELRRMAADVKSEWELGLDEDDEDDDEEPEVVEPESHEESDDDVHEEPEPPSSAPVPDREDT